MSEQHMMELDRAEAELLAATKRVLGLRFTHGDLANAGPEKIKAFGDLFSSLRVWVEAREAMGDAVHENKMNADEFPSNPRARTVVDLVTPKQLWMLRGLARDAGIDPDERCEELLHCSLEEISKRAASCFITYLKREAGIPE